MLGQIVVVLTFVHGIGLIAPLLMDKAALVNQCNILFSVGVASLNESDFVILLVYVPQFTG